MVFLLDSMCRLCMSQEGILYPIFYQDASGGPTHNLPSKIMTFAAVKVYEGDGLPTLICQQCIHQVNRSYDFKIQCENSDAMLRQYASNMQASSFQHLTGTGDQASGANPSVPSENGGTNPTSKDSGTDFLNGSSNGSVSSTSFAQESPPESSSGDTPYVIQELVPMKMEKESPLAGIATFTAVSPSSQVARIHAEGYILQELSPTKMSEACPPWVTSSMVRRPSFPVHVIHGTSDAFTQYGEGCRPDDTSGELLRLKTEAEVKKEPAGECGESPDGYHCPICERQFLDGKGFEVHIRSHMGNGNVCPVCHKRFAGNNSLRVHVGIHARMKPHRCSVCNKCFAQKGQLKVHTRLHTGERPYQCHICQEAFFQMVSLSNHIKRNHTGETPFKCMLCGKSFTSKSVLTGHINIHTRRYECPVCHDLFTRKKHLTTHLKMQHAKS
ncbi:zinc finger protein 674-like [Bacillus rossius redtenbacheri]|uniref:zinc finger protein 674-like n=1 Tax=Bacillus rossius redtenbacheri TaxID=93214 RepID=UPI002FDDE7F4